MRKCIAIVTITVLCLGAGLLSKEQSVQHALIDVPGPHYIISNSTALVDGPIPFGTSTKL